MYMLSTGCSGGYVANSPTVLPPESTGFPLQEIMLIKVAIKTTLEIMPNDIAIEITLHISQSKSYMYINATLTEQEIEKKNTIFGQFDNCKWHHQRLSFLIKSRSGIAQHLLTTQLLPRLAIFSHFSPTVALSPDIDP